MNRSQHSSSRIQMSEYGSARSPQTNETEVQTTTTPTNGIIPYIDLGPPLGRNTRQGNAPKENSISEINVQIANSPPRSLHVRNGIRAEGPLQSSKDEAQKNLDNPFLLFTDLAALRQAVELFADRHGLHDYKSLLVWASYRERNDLEAQDLDDFPEEELSEEARFERDESGFLETPSRWRTARKELRNLKSVLIVGLLSGACQGWNQSIIAGTGIMPLVYMSN